LGEENTPLLNLLSSPREESYLGTKATLHRERRILHYSPTLITERGEPPRLLFIGSGKYSITQLTLITERGEPPGLLFIGIGEYSTAHSTPITERGEPPRSYSSSG